jgi:leucyl-tRNA synthetase
MSKSKDNSISPDELIEEYGADIERLYTLFLGPPAKDAEWDDQAIVGCERFLYRTWTLVHELRPKIDEGGMDTLKPEELDGNFNDLHIKTHQTIEQVTSDFEDRLHPNTAISALMELVNTINDIDLEQSLDINQKSCLRFAVERLVKLLSPFAPHIAEEMWQDIGRSPSIFERDWPRYEEQYTEADEVEIVIQVDGTVRERMDVPRDISEEDLKEQVKQNDRVQDFLEGDEPERMIVVPEKLVNVVT